MGGRDVLYIEVHFFVQISIYFLHSTLPLFYKPKALCSPTNKKSHIRLLPFSLRLRLASSPTSTIGLKRNVGRIRSEPEETRCDSKVRSPSSSIRRSGGTRRAPEVAPAAPLSQSPGKGQERFIKNPPPCAGVQA